MPLEFLLESLDQVEESIRGAYEEREGKFHLDPDKYAEIKAQGLKNKNKELLTALDQTKPIKARAEKFKDVTDQDWDDYQNWKQEKAAGDGGDDDPKRVDKGGQAAFEKAIAKEKQRFERDVAAAKAVATEKDQKIAELEGQIREFSIWGPVRDMAIAAKVLPDRLDAFVTLLRSQKRFDLDESNNNKLIFKDKDGYPTTVTPEGAFKTELKNEFAWAFQASESGGSGASKAAGGKLGADLSKMNAQERMKYAREHGIKE